MFDNIYNNCKDNINIDKKVYIFWHLFLFVRMLIRNFVEFHKYDKYYNEQLDNGRIEYIFLMKIILFVELSIVKSVSRSGISDFRFPKI